MAVVRALHRNPRPARPPEAPYHVCLTRYLLATPRAESSEHTNPRVALFTTVHKPKTVEKVGPLRDLLESYVAERPLTYPKLLLYYCYYIPVFLVVIPSSLHLTCDLLHATAGPSPSLQSSSSVRSSAHFESFQACLLHNRTRG